MYNQELESLMDTLLEDGVLTDKKKEILLKKAQVNLLFVFISFLEISL